MGPAGNKTLLQWFNISGFNEGISYGGADRVKRAFKRQGQQEAVVTSGSSGQGEKSNSAESNEN